MNLKKGDNVIVIAGKDKGKKGKIAKVLRETNGVLVEGLNLRKKRQRPRKQGEKGQTIDMPHPIHTSNVQIFCSGCGKGVRVGASENTKNKVRVCKSCGKEV